MKIDIQGKQYELNEDIKKYITKKLKSIEKKIPSHARKSAHAIVTLTENKKNKTDRFGCEIVLRLPNEELVAHESTLNMFAAFDIVEEKLKNQIKKYKSISTNHRADRKGTFSRIRKMADRDWWGRQN